MRINFFYSFICPPQRDQFLLNAFCAVAMMIVSGSVPEARAQDSLDTRADTVIVENRDSGLQGGPDTVAIKSYAKRFSPRKAILFAAILPGLGQVYNKKYWKLPLVYGGFYAIGYYIDFYNDAHQEFKSYLFQNLEEGIGENEVNANLPDIRARRLTTTQLRTTVDRARRERDFMIILMGGMYILQMIDAHVDAHLKEFDLNPQLQVSIEPSMDHNALAGRTVGMSLVFRF